MGGVVQCGKIFKNADLVSFHAEKSGHSNFEESTEEVSRFPTMSVRRLIFALLLAPVRASDGRAEKAKAGGTPDQAG
jgi:hypothetical protein